MRVRYRSPAEAQPFLSVRINVQGHAEMAFDDQPLFFDRRASAVNLGKQMDELYDLARELLPDYYERG